MRIGLLGYGRLGRLLTAQLSADFEWIIHDPAHPGEAFASMPEAAACEIVVLAVPISAMEPVCREIAPFLQPGQLLMDTCSVKMHPLEVMRRFIPEGIEIIGTHPLFGPDSARDGLRGHKVVLCPLTHGRVSEVSGYLESRGLRVIMATPEEHDRAMAETQCLFHLMARAIQEMGLRTGEIATPGPARLYSDFGILQQDTRQLFIDLQNLNPFAAEIRRRFIDTLLRLDASLAPD
jgi:prephenate dehydrogenase